MSLYKIYNVSKDGDAIVHIYEVSSLSRALEKHREFWNKHKRTLTVASEYELSNIDLKNLHHGETEVNSLSYLYSCLTIGAKKSLECTDLDYEQSDKLVRMYKIERMTGILNKYKINREEFIRISDWKIFCVYAYLHELLINNIDVSIVTKYDAYATEIIDDEWFLNMSLCIACIKIMLSCNYSLDDLMKSFKSFRVIFNSNEILTNIIKEW